MNDKVVLERGKKLYPGDVITIKAENEDIDIKVMKE